MGIKIHGTDIEQKGILRFSDPRVAMDAQIMDDQDARRLIAQDVALITTANNGIPSMFTAFVDPKVVEVLTAPLKATELFPEVQKGDWTTETDVFMNVEFTGETAPYGDFANEGVSGHNVEFPQRQAYGFQNMTIWGDRQVAVAGQAKLNYVSLQQKASAMILMRRMNEIYLNGISGLQNYGILNDPNYIASAVPTTGAGGNTWALKTYAEKFADFKKAFSGLVSQTVGLVDANTPMICAIPPSCDAQLSDQNSFGQSLRDQLKKEWPNLSFVTIPEFATASGNLMRLIVPSFDGMPTGEVAFCEKMRAHGVIRKASSYEEKKSSRAFGHILYRPAFVYSILGI